MAEMWIFGSSMGVYTSLISNVLIYAYNSTQINSIDCDSRNFSSMRDSLGRAYITRSLCSGCVV